MNYLSKHNFELDSNRLSDYDFGSCEWPRGFSPVYPANIKHDGNRGLP